MKLEEYKSTDIYLLDQIMKGRYDSATSVLDVGAGSGRNLFWFLQNDIPITAVDISEESRGAIEERYGDAKVTWKQSDLDSLPFEDTSFDHVICNAVLHFAKSKGHFDKMLAELLRVCKPGGSVFIRTCAKMGIEDRCVVLGGGRYLLPDESERYLIDLSDLNALTGQVALLEPPKWVNVANQRVMLTLVLQKL